jgi:hypothetical protein
MATGKLLICLAAFNQELTPHNAASRMLLRSSQMAEGNCHSDTPETAVCTFNKRPMKSHIILEHDNVCLHITHLTTQKTPPLLLKCVYQSLHSNGHGADNSQPIVALLPSNEQHTPLLLLLLAI